MNAETLLLLLCRRDKNLVVATMDGHLITYSTKGKMVWKVKLPGTVTCIEQMDIPGTHDREGNVGCKRRRRA